MANTRHLSAPLAGSHVGQMAGPLCGASEGSGAWIFLALELTSHSCTINSYDTNSHTLGGGLPRRGPSMPSLRDPAHSEGQRLLVRAPVLLHIAQKMARREGFRGVTFICSPSFLMPSECYNFSRNNLTFSLTESSRKAYASLRQTHPLSHMP